MHLIPGRITQNAARQQLTTLRILSDVSKVTKLSKKPEALRLISHLESGYKAGDQVAIEFVRRGVKNTTVAILQEL